MGNLCGKESKEDNFTGPGRVLGAAPAQPSNAKASVPATQKPKVTGPGRTLGSGEPSESSGGDARSAAARAAEARATKPPSGDLQKKLDAQKRQTQNQTLQSAADENRLRREADQATETRNYN